MCALPTILETATSLVASIGAGGAQRLAGTAGVETVLRIYNCTGLTSSYTRALAGHASALVVEATWSYSRIGGAGRAELLVKGGLADMDTAVQNEWEVELERGDPVVWYRGRIIGYKHETTPNGDTMTRLTCEGYLTKLAQIKIDKDYTSSTVKVIVTDILDTYVTPNTRIAYTAADIVGGYTVNSVSFKGRTVLEAIEMLGMLQGSTEWGVTEGNPKPQFYFLAEGSGTSETQVLQLGKDAKSITAEGSFATGYSTVKVIGGWTAGAIITGSYTDATAQTAYGKREKVISDSAILNASDANRLAQNYAAVYANGNSRYHVDVIGPSTRIEPDRTSGSIAAAKKATIRGIDGAQVTDFFGGITYKYQATEGGAPNVTAQVQAGLPDDCVQAIVARIDRTVQSLVQQVQQYSTGTPGVHDILSATHSDTTAATLVRGDTLVVDSTPKLVRLATGSGNAGKFLQSNTVDTLWSSYYLPSGSLPWAGVMVALTTAGFSVAATQNSAVFVTDSSGTPQFSTDLPSGTTKGGTEIAGTGANTYTGAQTLSGAPTSDLHASTKLYADGGGGTVTLTDAAPTSLDPTAGKRFLHTAAGNRTVNATVGTPDGKMIVYEVKSDSATPRTITFGTNFLSTGTLITPASSTLVVSVTFISDGTNYKEISRQATGI